MSDDTLRIVNQPGNLLRTVQNMIDQDAAGQLFRATVVETTDNTIRIQRTGHDPDVAQYAVLDNFPYPRVGDEVLMARVGSGWMVVGSVLRSGLAENYLKIETKLTIEPGGSIEDADGSVWNQDGITLFSAALATDSVRFLNPDENHELDLVGIISSTTAGLSILGDYKPDGLFTEATGLVQALGEDQTGALRSGEVFLQATAIDDTPVNHVATFILTATSSHDGTSDEFNIRIRETSPNAGAGVNIHLNNDDNNSAGMKGGILFGNVGTQPTGNPSGGGALYVVAGALTWRGSGGTITTIAVA